MVVLAAFSQTIYGQVTSKVMEEHVLHYTSNIEYDKLNRDTITTYSYLVLFDERSEVDTIALSSLPDSLLTENTIIELRRKYENLPARGIDLANAGIFVPVLIMPYEASYSVLMDKKTSSDASRAWRNLFAPCDLQTKTNKFIKFTIPVIVTAFPAME